MSRETGRRGQDISSLRRTTRIVLIVGTVLAIAAAFGPLWVTRVGVLIALLAAVLSVRLAWTEFRRARNEHAREKVAMVRAHGEQLSAERSHNQSVVATLSEQNQVADLRITELRTRIGLLRSELSTVRGDHISAQGKLAERNRQIAVLRRDLTASQTELAQLREAAARAEQAQAAQQAEGQAADQAEVVSLPRHAATDWDALPSAEDLWSDGNHPTVVDLQQLAFPPIETTEAKKQA